jgi:ABC-type transporter MlaC component
LEIGEATDDITIRINPENRKRETLRYELSHAIIMMQAICKRKKQKSVIRTEEQAEYFQYLKTNYETEQVISKFISKLRNKNQKKIEFESYPALLKEIYFEFMQNRKEENIKYLIAMISKDNKWKKKLLKRLVREKIEVSFWGKGIP